MQSCPMCGADLDPARQDQRYCEHCGYQLEITHAFVSSGKAEAGDTDTVVMSKFLAKQLVNNSDKLEKLEEELKSLEDQELPEVAIQESTEEKAEEPPEKKIESIEGSEACSEKAKKIKKIKAKPVKQRIKKEFKRNKIMKETPSISKASFGEPADNEESQKVWLDIGKELGDKKRFEKIFDEFFDI